MTWLRGMRLVPVYCVSVLDRNKILASNRASALLSLYVISHGGLPIGFAFRSASRKDSYY
ncbi:hypothetical protein BDZ91DRAFT_714552, partial [Kalaharituber pfeilii]